jgi:glycosyltransferase involved in cell wall biosynthesis
MSEGTLALPGSHVLIVVENLPVPFDRRVWMEATSLREAGYEVSVICPMGKGYEAAREVIDGIHVYRHPLPPDVSSVWGYLREYGTALRWEWTLARTVARRRRIDIVHICNPPDLLFLVAGWLRARYGAAVIYDQHDLNPEMYEAKYARRDLFYHALSAAERVTFGLADVVIATNESHREVALTRGRKATDDVFIVRSGPELERFRPVPPNPIHRRGRGFLVGYVGVIGEPEGLDLLLQSVLHIVHDIGRRDIHFMLIGGGPKRAAMEDLSRELGVAEWVEFPGRVPDDELIERLCTADICVAPDVKSRYNDHCTMNKVLEYMALGRPIVQFDLVEGRRSAEEASLYARDNDPVDFARQMLRLLDEPGLRARLGAEGRRRMETTLEWRHQRPRLLAAYERADDPGRRRRARHRSG